MGQYHSQKCPICGANIQLENEMIERCPSCKEYIGDKLGYSGDGTGLTTATAKGEGLKPLSDTIQDTFG